VIPVGVESADVVATPLAALANIPEVNQVLDSFEVTLFSGPRGIWIKIHLNRPQDRLHDIRMNISAAGI
jgi:hypothetical protein